MPKREPRSFLSPDELIRFRAEADWAYHHNEHFTWMDGHGRRWHIRPANVENQGVILFQWAKGDKIMERVIPHGQYTPDKAVEAIMALDEAA